MGWWWWWSKKKFFNFAETRHTGSPRYINVHNFRVLVKQLSYGNEIESQVWKLGKNLQGISTQKNIYMEITCKMNWEKFKRDFLIKNIIHRNYLSNEVGKIYN